MRYRSPESFKKLLRYSNVEFLTEILSKTDIYSAGITLSEILRSYKDHHKILDNLVARLTDINYQNRASTSEALKLYDEALKTVTGAATTSPSGGGAGGGAGAGAKKTATTSPSGGGAGGGAGAKKTASKK